MSASEHGPPGRQHAYVALCTRLDSIGRALGIDGRKTHDRNRSPARAARQKEMESALALSALGIPARCVTSASRTLGVIVGATLACCSGLALWAGLDRYFAAAVFITVAGSYLAKEAVEAYPRSAASKRASRVLKGSTSAVNLMIMSLRHEPSVPKAIRFASRRAGEFSRELTACTWKVLMGTESSFEEALHRLGSRWERHSGELKTAMNAMVTASCERTEEGKRRALERANNAVVGGAKRRIEEYALSLSTPSMILFGLGILLPLMIGSFLPMLSWDLWSGEGVAEASVAAAAGDTTVQMVFLMNVLFPAIALMVAMEVVSRHPLERAAARIEERPKGLKVALGCALGTSAACCALSLSFLDGMPRATVSLLGLVVPSALALMACGRRTRAHASTRGGSSAEDILFKTGARMLEGENFESALAGVGNDLDGEGGRLARALTVRCCIAGQDFDHAVDREAEKVPSGNVLEGLKVVREAAQKDERGAGLLAMDLASYLRDLRDIEGSLRSRIKPTISMMRMTAHALAPVVLGVTLSIYLSLASVGGESTRVPIELTFMVLGLFLAQMNAVVAYYVWGIEGGGSRTALAHSVGSCLIVSEALYAATSVLAT